MKKSFATEVIACFLSKQIYTIPTCVCCYYVSALLTFGYHNYMIS